MHYSLGGPARTIGDGSQLRSPEVELQERVTVPSNSECPPAPFQGRRILVVDDVHDYARSLALLFEISGHEVRVAYCALEAIQIAERFRPAVIFMDIGLPVMDGFEAIRRIRAEWWGRDITICTLTGFDSREYCQRSQELGVSHHFVKPTDFQVLARVAAAST